MFKNTLLSSMLLSFLLVPYSFGDNVVASKGYVDTQIDTTQVKIPAAGTAGVPLGTTVMTYTSTSGEIGERGIYDGSSNYDASNDSDKIITASALKGAMDSLPTVSTNKLTCANTGVCNLWTIVDQTAYGNGGGGAETFFEFDWTVLNDRDWGSDKMNCEKYFPGSPFYDDSEESECLSNIGIGQWISTTQTSGTIKGTSWCSSIDPFEHGYTYEEISDGLNALITSEYNEWDKASRPDTMADGYCYCRTESPGVSRWVYLEQFSGSCGYYCPGSCAGFTTP